MEWDTVLNKTKPQNSPFQSLGNSLLRSYLLVMLTIWLVSGVIVYEFFSRSLYQQLDQRLDNLADAGAHSIGNLKKNPHHLQQDTGRSIDHDQDLDIPWQNLKEPQQSIEWFDLQGQRLAHSGNFTLSIPLQKGFQTTQEVKVRSLTIVAYGHHPSQKTSQGYVRASETTQSVDAALHQLRWGFALGGLAAFGLMSLGGIWLTRKSIQPVEKSFQQLKQFTADASHELRSPLTAIQTSVAVMQSHPERVHPLDKDKLEGIVSATKQITHLVEDLLLLARNEAQLLPTFPHGSLIPLEELLEDVIEQQEFLAEAKEIDLRLQEGNFSVVVKGDGSKLLRLFANLVQNALQYTPHGGKVLVCLESLDKRALVRIIDTGMGIAPEHLPLIFDRFWRADQARSYREEGSGLGLAIVKTLAQEHGGDVSVSSICGKGTCFTVWLPLTNL